MNFSFEYVHGKFKVLRDLNRFWIYSFYHKTGLGEAAPLGTHIHTESTEVVS